MLLPVMRGQRSGLIVQISSTAGIAGQEFVSAYAASKFAVEGWIESLTPEVAPFGIRTMLVEPGFFRTELLTEESKNYPEPSIDAYAEKTRQTVTGWKGMNGLQRGDPAKLAKALVQLASQDKIITSGLIGHSSWWPFIKCPPRVVVGRSTCRADHGSDYCERRDRRIARQDVLRRRAMPLMLTPQTTYIALLIVQALHLLHHRLVKRHISFAEVISALVLCVPPWTPVPGVLLMSIHVTLIVVQLVGSLWIKKLSPEW